MNIDFYRFTDFYRLTTPGKFAYKTTKFYAINEQEEILLLSYHALTADLDRRPRIAGAWINYHQNERCAKTAKWRCYDYCFCSLLASLGSDLSRAEKKCCTHMRYMQKNASNQSLVCKLSLNVVVNHDLALFIYLFLLLCFFGSRGKIKKKKKRKKRQRKRAWSSATCGLRPRQPATEERRQVDIRRLRKLLNSY